MGFNSAFKGLKTFHFLSSMLRSFYKTVLKRICLGTVHIGKQYEKRKIDLITFYGV